VSAPASAARGSGELPLLHVTNGDSAASTLRKTALGGDVVSWRDALHEGPVPALPRGELMRTRARFLAECGWGRADDVRASLEERDRRLLDALGGDCRVVLWFEHDLYDQLQLVDVLALAAASGAAPELIVVGSFLGPLPAHELEALWPSRREAPPAALATATSVWAAFRAPEPTALADWAARDDADLPFLRAALRRLLEELPSAQDGLSATERRALEAVAGGAAAPPEAFVAAQRLEDAAFLGDTWFYRTLTTLGRGEGRLIEDGDGLPLPAPPPLGDAGAFARLRLRLTPNGERVLRGQGDRVELLGIDRWLGGTHLTPGNAWRWDVAAAELVRPA
jgi:hypothetical protein